MRLNPFWFRAGGVISLAALCAVYAVLIPFGSGLGGFKALEPLATAILVLIPFGSGLGGFASGAITDAVGAS